MSRPEKLLTRKNAFVAMAFIIGATVGSGGVWSLLEQRARARSEQLDRQFRALELRDRIQAKLLESHRVASDPAMSHEMRMALQTAIRDDVIRLEQQAAGLEGRAARPDPFAAMVPATPSTTIVVAPEPYTPPPIGKPSKE